MPEIEDLSGRKLGEFVLRARIGEGGFGAVYRCEQPLLGREAVVKVLHPRLRDNGVVGNSRILTASGDGTARLWDAETGRHQKSFVADVDIDPGGTMVATAGGDGAVRFWDASSGHMLWTLQAHRGAVVGVHFDGTSVVTRSLTGEVARWELAPLHAPGLTVDRIVRCFPIRFDDDTGGLVEQDPRCDT